MKADRRSHSTINMQTRPTSAAETQYQGYLPQVVRGMAIERAIQELERRRLVVFDDHDKQLRGTSHTTTSEHPGSMDEEEYPTLTAAIVGQKKGGGTPLL